MRGPDSHTLPQLNEDFLYRIYMTDNTILRYFIFPPCALTKRRDSTLVLWTARAGGCNWIVRTAVNEVGAELYFEAGLRERMQFEVAPVGSGGAVGPKVC